VSIIPDEDSLGRATFRSIPYWPLPRARIADEVAIWLAGAEAEKRFAGSYGNTNHRVDAIKCARDLARA
jgi:hypothetical protein